MSNKRITDLTELTTPTTDDVFPVVDIATNTTTKVQLGNLPVPTSVTTALATKENTITPGTTAQYYRGDKSFQTLDKTAVGLGNVDNTSDANKPVSTATQTALNAKQDTLVSGTNIKTLNSTSLLGSGNIVLTANPSGVAGAIQFSNGSAFASDASNLFWDDTNNRLGVGTNAPSTTVDILPPTQTATASQFDCFRVGYSNSTIGVTNFPAFQVQVATTGTSRFSTTLRLSGGSDTSQAYLKGFASNNFGVMLNRTNSNLGLFSDNGIKLGDTVFAGQDGAASAMVHIKGSGSTSATTSLLVQNSAGNSALTIKDDLSGIFTGIIDFQNNVNLRGANFTQSNLNMRFVVPGATKTFLINADYGDTNAPSAILEVQSTTKGFLPPRMTTTQKNAIATPAAGLVVYDSTTNKLCCYNGSTWNDLF